jgi:hypothetical protein
LKIEFTRENETSAGTIPVPALVSFSKWMLGIRIYLVGICLFTPVLAAKTAAACRRLSAFRMPSSTSQ